jgi:hypothetical protein
MLNIEHRGRVLLQIAIVLSLGLWPGTEAHSQVKRAENPNDRAEQEAEQMVSLSAAAIQQILVREPGLLLEVKKTLVRKAYEQGRLLDPGDLSDETLFALLRQDNNVRILATREIEARMYIRAKPKTDELQKKDWRTQPLYSTQDTHGEEPQQVEGSQEQQYWSTHHGCPLARLKWKKFHARGSRIPRPLPISSPIILGPRVWPEPSLRIAITSMFHRQTQAICRASPPTNCLACSMPGWLKMPAALADWSLFRRR